MGVSGSSPDLQPVWVARLVLDEIEIKMRDFASGIRAVLVRRCCDAKCFELGSDAKFIEHVKCRRLECAALEIRCQSLPLFEQNYLLLIITCPSNKAAQ